MIDTKIIDAFPPTAPGRRPYCVAKLSAYVIESNEWRAQKGMKRFKGHRPGVESIPVDQCGNFARYKINKKWYCRKHGALIALDLVAERVAS